MDRRTVMKGLLGTAAAAAWVPPDASALGLPKDKIKRIRYYKTPTDAAGRPNIHQPTFNQSTNIVVIETQSGLIGVGEGGEGDALPAAAEPRAERTAGDGAPDAEAALPDLERVPRVG